MSDATYQLLQLKEKMKDNLSSAQIASTLDELLFRAIEPVLMNTSFVEQFLSDVLSYTVHNSRRKLSYMESQKFHDALFSIVAGKSKVEKMAMIRKLRLERIIYFMILSAFVELGERWQTKMSMAMTATDQRFRAHALFEMQEIEKRLGYNSKIALFSIVNQSRFWLEHAVEFKQSVIEKYIRLAYTTASKAARSTGMTIDKEDLFRDLVISVNRAIDKYDSQRGTLTQYIRWWIIDGITNHKNPHQYGIAFTIPTAQRKKLTEGNNRAFSNLSVSLDELTAGENDQDDLADMTENVLQSLLDTEKESALHMIAIRSDPHKAISLVLGLNYKLSDEEIKTLRNTLPPETK